MNFRPPEVWLVTGPDRAERNALARRIAQYLNAQYLNDQYLNDQHLRDGHPGRAAHVDGEALWDQLLEGRADRSDAPGNEDDAREADRQYELSIRNQCLLARSYAEAGFTPVLDFPVATTYHLEAYQNYLAGAHLRLVAITPSEELEAAGAVRTTPDAPPALIIERAKDLLVRRV